MNLKMCALARNQPIRGPQASNGVRRPSFLIIFNSHLLFCTHTFARRSLSRITGAIFIIGIRPVRKTKKKREGSGMKKITGRRLCNAQLHGVQLSTDALHLAARARTRACILMIFRVSVFPSPSFRNSRFDTRVQARRR